MLSILTFLPVLGMIVIAFLPKTNVKMLRGVTVAVTALQIIFAIILWMNFNGSIAGINDPKQFQFTERFSWIRLGGLPIFGNIAIDYAMGIDGLSVLMVLLTALVAFVGAIASFSIHKNEKGYFMMYLLLVTGMMGVFVSLDFFLFYIFWELMLLPMYFLIGIWGGPRREYAAIKFFIYTLFGSIFMLLVMIGLNMTTVVNMGGTPYHTFNLLDMMNPANHMAGSIFAGSMTTWRYIGYLGLFLGFAIKIPMFPFHTWLPDAHVEAPTAISVILAGVLLKMGTYGILRICYGIFPEIAVATSQYLVIFGFINIVYGAFCAMAQKDLKKLIAYSSVSHMGYVLLGMASLNSQGMAGAIFQMFNHGTITAMLFLSVGVLYDQAHTRGLNEFGGLANKMPKYFALVVICYFASLGLPGFSGFISEAFVFLGSFQAFQFWTILSTLGIILTAAYMLWALQRMFLGTLPERWNGLVDIDGRELVALVPLAVIVIFLGIYPAPILNLMMTSVNQLADFVHKAAPHAAQAASILK
ncbi:MAG: NADH-quinone oxidoreductase subunit M [Bacteroidetes bacterium]|nr:NADH-quinone oxidoreductase subunit M [Bacteroidota bacterium]